MVKAEERKKHGGQNCCDDDYEKETFQRRGYYQTQDYSVIFEVW